MKHYPINEIFLSLQGEGARAGTPNVFIRFAGCNQTCRIESHGFDCDTEFTSNVKLSGEGIMRRVDKLWRGKAHPNVILTGGEPLLFVDDALTELLLNRCKTVGVETNGSMAMPDRMWEAFGPVGMSKMFVSCSPKVAEHAIRLQAASEVRYVRSEGQGIPKPKVEAEYHFLSPAWERGGFEPGALETCESLIFENPKWAMSVQHHKLWSVR